MNWRCFFEFHDLESFEGIRDGQWDLWLVCKRCGREF